MSESVRVSASTCLRYRPQKKKEDTPTRTFQAAGADVLWTKKRLGNKKKMKKIKKERKGKMKFGCRATAGRIAR